MINDIKNYIAGLRAKADSIEALLPLLDGSIQLPAINGKAVKRRYSGLHWTQDPKNKRKLLLMRQKQAKAIKKTWALKKAGKGRKTSRVVARTPKATAVMQPPVKLT